MIILIAFLDFCCCSYIHCENRNLLDTAQLFIIFDRPT